MQTYEPIVTAPRAGKEGYTCTQCGKPIPKGAKYLRVWYPPYHPINRYEGDVDDDGRSIAVEIPSNERHSLTHRVHIHTTCTDEYWETHY